MDDCHVWCCLSSFVRKLVASYRNCLYLCLSELYVGRSLGEKSKSFASSQNNAFDGSRKEINSAIDRICEFTGKHCLNPYVFFRKLKAFQCSKTWCDFSVGLGIKVVFWDLREPFIDNLYKHSVSHARLDTITEALDVVGNSCILFSLKIYDVIEFCDCSWTLLISWLNSCIFFFFPAACLCSDFR